MGLPSRRTLGGIRGTGFALGGDSSAALLSAPISRLRGLLERAREGRVRPGLLAWESRHRAALDPSPKLDSLDRDPLDLPPAREGQLPAAARLSDGLGPGGGFR